MQNYVTWIQIVLSLTLKLKMLMKILLMILQERFDASSYEVNRLLATGKNKKVIGLMKDKLGAKIMTEFAALRPNSYS